MNKKEQEKLEKHANEQLYYAKMCFIMAATLVVIVISSVCITNYTEKNPVQETKIINKDTLNLIE